MWDLDIKGCAKPWTIFFNLEIRIIGIVTAFALACHKFDHSVVFLMCTLSQSYQLEQNYHQATCMKLKLFEKFHNNFQVSICTEDKYWVVDKDNPFMKCLRCFTIHHFYVFFPSKRHTWTLKECLPGINMLKEFLLI